MKVYAVSGWTDFEGYDATSGVFSTLDKAKEFADTIQRDGYSIIEIELDNPDSAKEVG